MSWDPEVKYIMKEKEKCFGSVLKPDLETNLVIVQKRKREKGIGL
jgi:hypothetical protein